MAAMISVEEHLARVLAPLAPLPPRRLPLGGARGTVLAEDVTALLAVPPFDNSAMDGYAVRAADVAGASPGAPVALRVVADLPAGSGERPEVVAGTAVRIMTGAPMPPGADAVVPVEDTDQAAGPGAELPAVVQVRTGAPAGRHVRRAGEDLRPGDPVLRRGRLLGSRDLSAAASVGHGDVLVHPPVRVGVLSTGAELVPPGTPPGPGQIPDSNTLLVAGLVAEAGAVPVVLGPVDDDPDALRRVLAEHVDDVDALVTTGGVSAGAFDVVKEALAPLGEVAFVSVAMQPGKPQGFGLLSRPGSPAVPLLALPGNPVSVFVSFAVFVAPALRRMRGLPDDQRAPRTAVATTGWTCPPGRRQYMPVVLDPAADGAAPGVRPAAGRGSGSHLVGSLARAEALAVVEAGVAAVAPGDVLPLLEVP